MKTKCKKHENQIEMKLAQMLKLLELLLLLLLLLLLHLSKQQLEHTLARHIRSGLCPHSLVFLALALPTPSGPWGRCSLWPATFLGR